MDRFNINDFDLIHIGVSGGKDSTDALLWLVYESGVPYWKIKATFCDTGNEDTMTYKFIKYLSDTVHSIKRIYPERDFWELAKWKQRFPKPLKLILCTFQST